jgi:hypothetical protein
MVIDINVTADYLVGIPGKNVVHIRMRLSGNQLTWTAPCRTKLYDDDTRVRSKELEKSGNSAINFGENSV